MTTQEIIAYAAVFALTISGLLCIAWLFYKDARLTESEKINGYRSIAAVIIE